MAMKQILVAAIFILVATVFIHDSLVFALDGEIRIHDPSTVIFCDGKYYTYGTGTVEGPLTFVHGFSTLKTGR